MNSRQSAIAFAILVGCVVVLFNFNGLMRHVANTSLAPESWTSRSLLTISHVPGALIGTSTETLSSWMFACFAGLWAYLAVIVLLALVRGRIALVGWGFGGVAGGVLTPSLLFWLAIVAYVVFAFIGRVVAAIFRFLAPFLLYAIPAVLLIALLVAIVAAWKEHGRLILGLGAAATILYFLAPMLHALYVRFLQPVLQWIGRALAVLFGWLSPVLVWIVKLVAVLAAAVSLLGVIGCAGHLVLEQIRTAIEAGRSQKLVLTNSFSLGISFALILLVSAGSRTALPATTITAPAALERSASSARPEHLAAKRKRKKTRKQVSKPVTTAPVAEAPLPTPDLSIAEAIDRGWIRSTHMSSGSPTKFFLATLPERVQKWSGTIFETASIPLFDAAIVCLTLFLSFFGLFRGMLWRSDVDWTVRFVNKDLVMIAVVPFLVLLQITGAAPGNQD